MICDKAHPLFGKCYVIAEALYYALKGKANGFKVMRATHDDISHWWLESPDGEIIDITRGQFLTPFPYNKGRRTAFLSQKMSRRTKSFLRND